MNKVIVVTGATGGLGSAIARAFGAAGNKVLVHYSKSQEKAADVAADIKASGGQSMTGQADVRVYEQVENMVNAAVKEWGRLDVIACVHGTTLGRLTGTNKEKLLVEHTEEDWDLVLETDLKGTFNCLKAAAGPMIKQKDGSILIMSSGTGMRGRAYNSSYAAAKAGIYGLMKSAAWELGPHNIKVNAVNPGLVLHKMAVPNSDIEYFLNETTLRRTGSAEEVARSFVHFSELENVSGQIFNLDSRILS